MRIWIDTEFNNFKGEMISMALVAEDGSEFYEALPCPNPKPWVAQNVIPVLNTVPIPFDLFRRKLHAWLLQFDSIHLIADWPEDLANFCQAMVTNDGMCINVPSLTMELNRFIKADGEILHNALCDARANMLRHLELEIIAQQNAKT
jgi:hypothetical protein